MRHGFFSIQPDGTDLELLHSLETKVAYDKVRPSPNGKQIVFLECPTDLNDNCLCDEEEYKVKQVVVANLDGRNRRVIGKPEGGFNDYPNWSPDGRSIIFMHSSAADPVPILYRFDLDGARLSKLTDAPDLMVSDNHWNPNGIVTVVAQPWQNGRPGIGNVYEFPADDPAKMKRLTDFTVDLGRHCCAADPKYSPDGTQLIYSRKIADDGEDGRWEIVSRSKDGTEQVLNAGQVRGYWPMWSGDGSRLMWVSFDGEYSIVIRKPNGGTDSKIKLIGEDVRLPMGERDIIFGRVNWPSWIGGREEKIFFPATYLDVQH